ncbi:MAG TPA: type I restriction endonuclease [Verrucomicrobiae bacterium]|jgi:type I site-specific restriction-modification system R (restriction) subunit
MLWVKAYENRMTNGLLHSQKSAAVRVVQQVHYSVHNENSIDLVLFLNGIPVATVELKPICHEIISNGSNRQYEK